MLAMADKDGEVMASIPGLADICRITIPQMEDALDQFLKPDKYSRTEAFEGRRIEKIPGSLPTRLASSARWPMCSCYVRYF